MNIENKTAINHIRHNSMDKSEKQNRKKGAET